MQFFLMESENVSPKNVSPENLVFEGGGVLGLAYCAALEELHKMNILAKVKNYAGSSAGAIVASALACGASFNFLLSEMSVVDLTTFVDYGNKAFACYNLYYYNGICPGAAFETWFGLIYQKN